MHLRVLSNLKHHDALSMFYTVSGSSDSMLKCNSFTTHSWNNSRHISSSTQQRQTADVRLRTPQHRRCFSWTQHVETGRLRPRAHKHKPSPPSLHPTELAQAGKIQWPGCRGNRAERTNQLNRWLVAALACLWACTRVGVCETVKPIQGSALSCSRRG